ncbi:MAG: DUF6686 family protein [Bacteroidota bacterium]
MQYIYDFQQPFELISEGVDHQIVFCYECQLYHVQYGPISLDLSDTGIQMLMNAMAYNLVIYDGLIDASERCIEVEIPTMRTYLTLSIQELHQLRELLQHARQTFHERLRIRRSN